MPWSSYRHLKLTLMDVGLQVLHDFHEHMDSYSELATC